MLLKADEPLWLGEPVEVSFALPDGARIVIAGAVCRLQRDCAAIQFDAGDARRVAIERWIDATAPSPDA